MHPAHALRALGEGPEVGNLVRLDVDEIEARRLLEQGLVDHAPEIALDHGDRHQDSQPQPQGQHHGRRRRARPVQVGDRQAQAPGGECRAPGRARAVTPSPASQKAASAATAPSTNHRAKRPLLRRRHRQHGEGEGGEPGQGSVVAPRPPAQGRHQAAEQAARRYLAGARHRPDGKGERSQEAEGGGQCQWLRIEGRAGGDRQQVRKHRRGRERRQRTQCQAEGDADAGQDQDLRQVSAEDEPRGRAEALQGGDDRGLALEIAAHGVAHADPADQERRQTDHGHEQGQAPDQSLEAGRGVAHVAHPPAGVGEGGVEVGDPGRGASALAQAQPVEVADEAAEGHKPGLRQRLRRQQHARSEGEAAGAADAVRFPHDGGAHLE